MSSESAPLTSNTSDMSALCAQALVALSSLSGSLAAMAQEMAAVPGFIRAFVEKDLANQTGFSIAEWREQLEDMRQSVQHATAPHDARAAHVLADDLLGSLASLDALLSYVVRVPDKLGVIPSQVLPPASRRDFLDVVNTEGSHLRLLMSTLNELGPLLRAYGRERA